MMEAMSGAVAAAGIYLKVAAGMDKEGRDRIGERERGEVSWPCNERKDLAGEASIPCLVEDKLRSGSPRRQKSRKLR